MTAGQRARRPQAALIGGKRTTSRRLGASEVGSIDAGSARTLSVRPRARILASLHWGSTEDSTGPRDRGATRPPQPTATGPCIWGEDAAHATQRGGPVGVISGIVAPLGYLALANALFRGRIPGPTLSSPSPLLVSRVTPGKVRAPLPGRTGAGNPPARDARGPAEAGPPGAVGTENDG